MKQFLSKGWRCYIIYFPCGEKSSLVKNVIYSLRKQANSESPTRALMYSLYLKISREFLTVATH